MPAVQSSELKASEGDSLPKQTSRRLRDGSVLLSLCGVLVCNALGFGLGRVVCHGLLIASLGAPIHKA